MQTKKLSVGFGERAEGGAGQYPAGAVSNHGFAFSS